MDYLKPPLLTFGRGGTEIVVQAGREVPLCTLRYVDGRWTAEYRPEDLDESARVFLETVSQIGASEPADRSALRDVCCTKPVHHGGSHRRIEANGWVVAWQDDAEGDRDDYARRLKGSNSDYIALSRRLDAAEAQVARVRARHHPEPCPVPDKHEGCQGTGYCAGCGHEWPCADIQALDAPSEPAVSLEPQVEGPIRVGSSPSTGDLRDRLWAVRGMSPPPVPDDLVPYPSFAESWRRGYIQALSAAARIARGEPVMASQSRPAPEPGTAEHGSWKPEIFPIVDALRDVDWAGFDPSKLDDLAELAALVLGTAAPPPDGPLLPEPTE